MLVRVEQGALAFAILCGLIERVSVQPGKDGFEIELESEIALMVEVALGTNAHGKKAATNDKAALRRLVLDD